ncbi:MAG: FixH family protein [Arcobacter sp.]|uniref:FixH family protein n=1 Tax=Arcobacter sp. TaxID=1872629 RepID=UPI003CFED95B
MKNLFKTILTLVLALNFLNAEPINQNGEKDGYNVTLTSEKSLVVGDNEFVIKLVKDEKTITTAKVKIKFFMPEMPGMPYMEYEGKAELVDGVYRTKINFSMAGTWQYQLKFKTDDDVVHTIRGSVNI